MLKPPCGAALAFASVCTNDERGNADEDDARHIARWTAVAGWTAVRRNANIMVDEDVLWGDAVSHLAA